MAGALLKRLSGPKPRWAFVGSAVLVKPDAILTATHVLKDKFRKYRFFLPGMGFFKLSGGWVTDRPGGPHGCDSVSEPGVPKDLALLRLEKPVGGIPPADLPPNKWQLLPKHLLRVCGFGVGSGLVGMRQCFELHGRVCPDDVTHLCFGDKWQRLDYRDSGGPVLLLKNGQEKPSAVVGINVRSPDGAASRGILLTGKTRTWVLDRFEEPAETKASEAKSVTLFDLTGKTSTTLGAEWLAIPVLGPKNGVSALKRNLEARETLTITVNAEDSGNKGVTVAFEQAESNILDKERVDDFFQAIPPKLEPELDDQPTRSTGGENRDLTNGRWDCLLRACDEVRTAKAQVYASISKKEN